MKTLLYVSEIPGKEDGEFRPGIAVYKIDEDGTPALRQRFPTDCTTNVSCADRDRGILYVTAAQTDDAKFREGGDRILMLRFDPKTGEILEKLGEAPTLSPNPVYLALDPTGRWLVAANHALHTFVHKLSYSQEEGWTSRPVYDDSTLVLYSLDEEGRISGVSDVAFHHGSGPLRTQTHAHPHSAVFSPSGELLAVCDKGNDRVFLYRIREGKLIPAGDPWQAAPGDEPRFCAFHPTLPLLYVNHEGNTGLSVLRYTEEGELRCVQTVDADPDPGRRQPGRVYENQGIAVHPRGSALYSVVRGLDCVAVYAIAPDTGLLALAQRASMEREWPRCGEISPDGRWFAAGNRITGELFVWPVEADGRLGAPKCVRHPCGVHYIRPMLFSN